MNERITDFLMTTTVLLEKNLSIWDSKIIVCQNRITQFRTD